MTWQTLIEHPGRPGPWGALMDETARAAEDFLRVVEMFDAAAWAAERAADDPDCRSPRAIAGHAVQAARGYVNIVLKGSGRPTLDRPADPESEIPRPADVRRVVREVLQFTERTVAALEGITYEQCRAMEVQVGWGPRYDPEMILEHGICHFLRHRRQLERWRSA